MSSAHDDFTADPWAPWTQMIRTELNRRRPERYDKSDREWMEPVIGRAAQTMPNQHKAIRIHAESEVYKQEGAATRRANREILRYADGNRPLLWADLGPLPFSVGGTRVRLDAGTPKDYDDAAQEQRADGKAAYERVLTRADLLEELANTARHRGLNIVSKIGDLPAREQPEGAHRPSDDFDDDEL
jgi:hypothetical protein